MTQLLRPTRRTALIAGAATLAAPWVHAQSAWPTKPVNVIAPFPPGGGTDAFARPLFAMMSKNTGKQFIIDNKGGAGPALQDLIAGQVDMMFDGLGTETPKLWGDDFGKFVGSGVKRWAAVVKSSGAKLD